MIPGNTLMKRNWVKHPLGHARVLEMHGDFVRLESSCQWLAYSEIKPIILTTNILEKKCKFETAATNECPYGTHFILGGKGTNIDGLFLYIDVYSGHCRLGQLSHFSHGFGKIKALHELQNLYQVLSGTELDVQF
jgi:hypothetical protein